MAAPRRVTGVHGARTLSQMQTNMPLFASKSLALLAALGLMLTLGACGASTQVGGSVIVQPDATATLEVEGKRAVRLTLHHTGSQPIVVIEGDTQTTMKPGSKLDRSFTGAMTFRFKNTGTVEARIKYQARSSAKLSTSLTQ